MKRLWLAVSLLGLAVMLAGCASPAPDQTSITTPIIPTATDTPKPSTLPTDIFPTATSLPALTDTPTNTPHPTPTDPQFLGMIIFTTDPTDLSAINRLVFSHGVKEIWAVWDYRNMKPGLTIRREWYLNEELWLVREVDWDFDKYGAVGQVTDVSIFDREQGLPPGNYRLRVYIDDIEQLLTHETFVIDASPLVQPLLSPDGRLTAIVEAPGTLIIREADGSQQVVAEEMEIRMLDWFPDSRHLAFTVVDRSEEGLNWPPDPDYWVRIMDAESGDWWPLLTPDQPLSESYHPQVSPTGRYIATLYGSGYGDACYSGWGLKIHELDDDLRPLERILPWPQWFEGLIQGDDIYPVPSGNLPRGGRWVDDHTLQVGLAWTCTDISVDDPAGVYLLHMDSLTAERVGDLE